MSAMPTFNNTKQKGSLYPNQDLEEFMVVYNDALARIKQEESDLDEIYNFKNRALVQLIKQ